MTCEKYVENSVACLNSCFYLWIYIAVRWTRFSWHAVWLVVTISSASLLKFNIHVQYKYVCGINNIQRTYKIAKY